MYFWQEKGRLENGTLDRAFQKEIEIYSGRIDWVQQLSCEKRLDLAHVAIQHQVRERRKSFSENQLAREGGMV